MRFFILLITVLFAVPAHAAQLQLKPYKDALFAYPAVQEQAYDGRYLKVAYDKQRDIYERDEIPLRKAKREYISSKPRWSRKVRTYRSAFGEQKMFAIGDRRSPKVTIIYLYGQGGNRFQGANDNTFGGNFNRLQNLMVRNDGLLLTPDYADFGPSGTADIAALIRDRKAQNPDTALIVACGSMGGGVCWQLADDPAVAPMLDGLFLLGSHWSDSFIGSPAFQRNVPVYFGHGTFDTVFAPERQKAFFQNIMQASGAYPARFVMFDTGKHGTPIRMVDWRRELNWMLALRR